jgi:uncharacterized membrane protein YeaQ/YmgE (transglycosylase-associated protein family)
MAMLYFNKNLSTEVHMTLTHRTISQYASGMHVWRDYYSTLPVVFDSIDYQSFLPVGLDAVGCTADSNLEVCSCLVTAHAKGISECKAVAENDMTRCFMMLRPVTEIDELDRYLNPFALLDTLNLWGMMGSVLIWIRQYMCKEDESMPYSMQTILGIFGAIIHCSVMEPTLNAYITYIVLVLVMGFISYLHRLDKEWWVSAYHVQYMFTLPNLVLLQRIFTQQRDFAYITFSFLVCIVFVFVTFAKTMLEQIKPETLELTCVSNCNRMVLFSLFLVLMLTSCGAAGTQYFQSVNLVTVITMFHLVLGLFGTANIKRTYLMELLFRVVITFNMVFELALANN